MGKRRPTSHWEVVDAFGGPGALAHAIGITPGIVAQWRRRGISPKYWLDVADAAAHRNISVTIRTLRDMPAMPPDAPPPRYRSPNKRVRKRRRRNSEAPEPLMMAA